MKFKREEKMLLINITKQLKEQIDYQLIHEEYEYDKIDTMLQLTMKLDLLLDKLYRW